MRLSPQIFILVLFVSIFFSSCLPTRNVQKGDFLIAKKFFPYKIDGPPLKDFQASNRDLIKTNQKVFALRLRLKVYDIGTWFKEERKINKWLTTKAGEAPILYDSITHQRSATNIENYLQSFGYFDAKVIPEVQFRPFLKTAFISYKIYPGIPFRISNINFNIDERDVKTLIQAEFTSSKIKVGDPFNIDALKAERERIATSLQNSGYYYFTSEQIRFEADTLHPDSIRNRNLDLTLLVTKIEARSKTNKDSLEKLPNRQYKLSNVYVSLISQDLNTEQKIDTTVIEVQSTNKQLIKYYFVHSGEMQINPKAIIRAIYVKPGSFYKKVDVLETNRSLSSLDLFNFINIVVQDISFDTAKTGLLNIIIQLSQKDNFNFSTASEVKYSGAYGLEQNVSLTRNNIFKNAEIFNIQARASVENQTKVNGDNSLSSFNLFNVFEGAGKMSLDFPRFIVPFQDILSPRYIKPRTKILIGYNYQARPDYQRTIVNLTYGYNSKPSSRVSNQFSLMELSSVKIFPTATFQAEIDNYNDPKIRYAYQNHLVINMRYAHTYKEQDFGKAKPYKYWSYNVELGGAISNVLCNMLKVPQDTLGQFLIGGIPFARYLLVENEFRYYIPIRKKINNVFRLYTGIGIPFGGSKGLPFEKSLYIGGANSLRAWRIGELGPGKYFSSADNFEKSGDVKIEVNYEFRFPISGAFEGAIFTDAGNVWLLHSSVEQPGGEFLFKEFLNQFAVDFGYGLRYNLDFMVIRLDMGHPMYQPYNSVGNRWTAKNSAGNLIPHFNLAISYPF